MPPRRRRASTAKETASSAELPESVWTRIAKHFSIKSWARVSGTNRTTFNLQLQAAAIPPDLPTAGVAWVSKRLRCAKALQLNAEDWQGLASTMRPGLIDLTSLQQLEMIGSPSVPGDGTMAHVMLFSWLLAGAPKLRILSARLGQIPWFPPLSHLKHLDLSFNGHVDVSNVLAALPSAQQLQTLSLSASEGVLETPKLDLESLSCLQSVGLDCVRPASTNLPVACCLHLKNLVEADFTCEKWNGAHQMVSTFDFCDNSLRFANTLPAFFTKLQNVTTVVLDVERLGGPENYLSLDGVSQAERLYIGGTKVYLKVPARVSWKQVMFSSENVMGLLFDDPGWFAESVACSVFRYLVLARPSLFEVTRGWAVAGRVWSTSLNDDTKQSYVECPKEASVDFEACCCGACMLCLGVSGVAIAHATEADLDADDSESESDADAE